MQKNNLFMISIVVLAIIISVPMFMANSSSEAQSAPPTRANHTPILIQSDLQLETSDAVTRGTGSPGDPYIIESWNIDADGAPYGIMIANTTRNLEIRFNQVYGGGSGGGGIFLRNVTNVVVLSNAVIDSEGNGIVVRGGSRSVSIEMNYIRGHSSYGIYLQNSYLIRVIDNWIGYGSAGIFMNGTAEVRAIHNSILHNDGMGIELASKSAATVIAKNSFVHNNGEGIQATDSGFGNMWFEKDQGNYWSDYSLRYPAAKNNGVVWDTMYRIVLVGGSGIPEGDNFPLVRPEDDLPPAVSELDLGEGYTGEPFQYMVNIGDDTYVDYAVARIWTETEELTPAMLWREDFNMWSLQFNLPNDSTEPIHVVVTAFDLTGNAASSNEGTITVIDDEPPTLVSSSISEVATTGDPFEVIVGASDNVGVDHVWIEYWVGADLPTVEEMVKGSNGDYKRTFVAPHVFEQKGRISIYIDDGTYNVSVLDAQFDIVDNDAPSIDGGSDQDIILGDYVVFHAPNATDNIGIANLTWSFKYRGGHVEVYGDVFNYTFPEVGDYPITLRASDAASLYDVAHFKVHVMPAPAASDLDKDGIPDYLDDDDDGDWWLDETEVELGLDPMNASSMPVDTDKDWIPDVKDTDDDCDGVQDTMDAFPLDPMEWADLDKDGTGDNADLDDDNDTMPDLWEISHGLDPRVAFVTDEDSDDDGLSDLDEFTKGTDPGSVDSDGDGMMDLFEVQNGLDPTRDDSVADSDADGYTNLQEYMSGTDPRSETSIPKEASSSGGKDGIAAGVVVGIAIAAAVAALIVAFLTKKGYDYYKAGSDLSSSGAMNNPMYEDKGNSGQNPLYDKRKGWDGTVKGSTKVDDDIPQPQGMAINEKGLPGDKPVKKGTKASTHRSTSEEPIDEDSDDDGLSDSEERKGKGGWDLATNKGGIEESSARKGWDGKIKGSNIVEDPGAESRKGWDGTVKGSTKVDEGTEAIRESPTKASTGKTSLRESPTKAQDHNSSRSNKSSSKHFEDGDIPDEEQSVSDISSGKHTKSGHVTLLK